MSSVEKRHTSHRVGGMLHHRFPNGFTDLFMDETDREVSTLTDRAFRSLCIGDEAVYNDELLYGYSPFSCHKPLVGQPLKKTHHKESKKQRQDKTDKDHAQPWKQQQQKNVSHMSSFLKALSATEESGKGMLITNGGITDSNGESWDKSALRSIQRELSEFSSDYHSNVTGGYYEKHHQHQSGDGSFNDAAIASGKSLKSKHGKSTIKLTKLIIKNFFLHSEFSPFQTWGDVKQFTFDREDSSILPTDSTPKWYDLPFYKELTEAHRKENMHVEELQSCQKATVEPPPPTAPKPIPPPLLPKVLPKPAATLAEKRCSSERGDGSAAPWRRNRSRAQSVIPVNLPGISVEENTSKTVDESLWLVRKEPRCVDVTAVEEVSSLASTPFSICQLMTPIIPSRQPTETSEILLTVLSPSCLDLPLRPHSEAKLTPEPAVKRDSYKSLASSILFNLKDNRKRVKSRYSPPKFKTVEVLDSGTHCTQSDNLKYSQACSEGYESGLSTPAIFTDQQTVCVPVSELINTPTDGHTKDDSDRPLSGDYLLSNLLQTNKAAGSLVEESPISPLLRYSKKNKSPRARMQNYPSLNLYKKASPVDSDMKHLVVPLGTGAPKGIGQPTETNKRSPRTLNKDFSQKALPTNTGVSPNSLNVKQNCFPLIPPFENEGSSLNVSLEKRGKNKPEKSKRSAKVLPEKDVSLKGKDASCQPMSTMHVIKAAREAINAAKNEAITTNQSNSTNKAISDPEEVREREMCKSSSPENNILSLSRKEAEPEGKKGNFKKVPPPVPKRNFAKSDILLSHNKEQTKNGDKLTNGGSKNAKLNSPTIEDEFDQKQGKLKHNFSARQNNYIKYQRYAGSDEQGEEFEEGDPKVNPIMEMGEETRPHKEMKDSEHIINDLNALKELQRARLGDRVLENANNKLSVINIDEEARAKNNLISRELRNIKKGMLSIRGNTTSKRELFAQKEKDQSKQETFAKIDSNVVINKALMNDNYDRAKMALEEIISERERRKNECTEQDPIFDENAHERCVTTAQQSSAIQDYLTEAKEKQNSSFITPKQNDFKERLGDLRDHHHIRQILSQSEPGLSETPRSRGRLTLLDIEKTEEMTVRYAESQICEESGEKLKNGIENKKGNTPLVPPRSKRRGSIRNGSVTTETDTLRDVVKEDIFNIDAKDERAEVGLTEIWGTVAQQYVNSDLAIREACQSETNDFKERWDVVNNAISKSTMITDKCESVLHSKDPQSENKLCISPEIRGHENKANNMHAAMSPTKATDSIAWAHETPKVKQKATLKPDHLNKPLVDSLLGTEEPDKLNCASEKIHADDEEIPRHITSPLLLVNGISVTQSPPDQASLSSKSSYFSVESALHKNTETESNVYHSLENLIGDVEKVDEETHNISPNTKQVLDGMEMEYYSLSDHESDPEVVKYLIKSPQKETEVPHMDSKGNTRADQTLAHDEENQTSMSHSNIFSPTLGIPALFKVKDITFNNNLKLKTIQPWSPRGSVSEWEEEVHQAKDNGGLHLAHEPTTKGQLAIPDEIFSPKESPLNFSPPLLPSPTHLQSENPKKPQAGGFLAVPREKDRSSGLSPASEGVESLTASTADKMGTHTGVSKVPSERSESTCSGNESQTGPPKPPVVLPKSEKAVLKAVKLANRRMKKEEAQKSSQKSSHSGSKHKIERPKSDKSEHRNSSSKNNKSIDINHREKSEDGHRHSESHHGKNSDHQREKIPSERKRHNNESHNSESHHNDQTDRCHRSRQQGHGSFQSTNPNNEALPSVGTERQGRSSRRDKREHRDYSSDRLISKVPVYKAQPSDRPSSDRPFQRSQSIDRYLGDKVGRRLSNDTFVNENLDPRTQRIEKSIMDELQQRGRPRDKTSRDNVLRRSHSIDACPNPSPSTLSHQSSQISHSSQLSRQSSFEHAIVAQSFPLTQRKLLQDPDSGQYFFVDMPLQVKTKTFFDPETGSYVQLPVQPPDGAVPQVSPLEVLTQPLVVYHSFVPVPLSPMAQKGAIQVAHMEPRLRKVHSEGHPYLEHVYGQQNHMLGEFLGTEELDCPS